VTDDLGPVIAALQRSGFPLQTRVEHEIRSQTPHGWVVLVSEYPWLDHDRKEQFIDLIAGCRSFVFVIECKKAQDRSLTFLRPVGEGTTGLVSAVTCWHLEINPASRSGELMESGLRDDIDLAPPSYRSEFCVATDRKGGDQRLLEQDARPLVYAAEKVLGFPREHLPNRTFIVPLLITTAQLYTLRYQPTEVSLETGEFSPLDRGSIEPISWIRFHKTLTAGMGGRARTVLVVNAAALPDFLKQVAGVR
jgi:hypothetical protein